jgi:hypothetical protein
MSDELIAILDHIAKGQHTDGDIEILRQLLVSGDHQLMLQLGKYNVNIGVGKDIRIGDHYYHESDQNAHIFLWSYFNMFSRHINILSTFKDFHDQLHRLEFEFYNLIILEIKRFPSDEAIEILVEYGLTLKSIIINLKSIDKSHILIKEIDLILELEGIYQKFYEAVDENNHKLLLQAIRLLERILNIHPSRINTHINTAAQSLHLIDLTEFLKGISQDQDIEDSTLHPDIIMQSSKGGEFLEKICGIHKDLQVMVKAHDSWQIIDIEFRQIENNIDNYIEELREDWNYLKDKGEHLSLALSNYTHKNQAYH